MVFVWYTMSFVAAALVFFLDYVRLFWQRYMCYDVIKTMLFVIYSSLICAFQFSNNLVLVTSFEL